TSKIPPTRKKAPADPAIAERDPAIMGTITIPKRFDPSLSAKTVPRQPYGTINAKIDIVIGCPSPRKNPAAQIVDRAHKKFPSMNGSNPISAAVPSKLAFNITFEPNRGTRYDKQSLELKTPAPIVASNTPTRVGEISSSSP